MFREWLLANFPDNYVCSVTFGDPTRPDGGGFFGRPAPWGNGIADFAIGDPRDYRHAWLTHDKDIYAQIPGGVVGDIMDDVYAEVARFAFKDLMQFTIRMITTVPTVASKAGISLPGALASLAGGPVGFVGFALPLALTAVTGLIPHGVRADELTGPAAAAKAAALGLEFLFAGTGPHIRYEFDAAWPGGPTYVDFAACLPRLHRPPGHSCLNLFHYNLIGAESRDRQSYIPRAHRGPTPVPLQRADPRRSGGHRLRHRRRRTGRSVAGLWRRHPRHGYGRRGAA
ncbi:MAG: hypothetical protein U5N53_11100 [Mycobacterium sp.]|nr:hypothetical protein [Mycobacterium sp.]